VVIPAAVKNGKDATTDRSATAVSAVRVQGGVPHWSRGRVAEWGRRLRLSGS